MLYVFVVPEQMPVAPEMAPGVAGAVFTVTASEVAAAEFPQALDGRTETFPPEVPKVTVMDVVLEPAVIVAPVGTVHAYPVAPLMAVME
jgi:hypothetical protein